MKIKALVPFSNGTISMEQYEVREVTDSLGNELISAGVAVEIGGGSADNRFIVTLTPTAQDFSGTMDKTPQEITAAHEAGREIVFNIVGYPGFDSVQINADWFTYATGHTYCAACATLVDLVSDMQIGIFTADIADTKIYETQIYPLTHAT